MNPTGKGGFVKGGPPGPGRPPGSLSLLTILKSALEEIPEGEKRSYAEKMIRLYRDDTIEKNDGTAIRDMIDRIDGKALQKVSVTNEKDTEWLELFKEVKRGVEAIEETDGDLDSTREAETTNTDT